jgi:hypothetical protein
MDEVILLKNVTRNDPSGIGIVETSFSVSFSGESGDNPTAHAPQIPALPTPKWKEAYPM